MFVIEVPYFNLDQIYNSKQAPRWIKLKESKYIVMHKDKALKIEQQQNRFDLNRYRLIMSCTEEDFYNIWFEYFDLRTDYFELNTEVRKLGGKFKVIANRGAGIHIIRQDTFEMLVFCFIVENVGYDKAKAAMNHIAEVCGIKHVQSMREAGKITWYEWPTPEMILEKHDKLKKMGCVNIWLKSICEIIVKHGLDSVVQAPEELFRLFGLHEVDKFPINGIEDTLAKNFDCEPEEFADWYLGDVKNKSLVYMYILHHIINPPKEVILRGIG